MMGNRARKLRIHGQDWQWFFGFPLRVIDPEGNRHTIKLGNDFIIDHEKKQLAMTPRMVAEIINRNLLGYTDRGGTAKPVPQYPKQGMYEQVRGPRGTWQYRAGMLSCSLISPEGIYYTPRVDEVFGKEWVEQVQKMCEERYPVFKAAAPDVRDDYSEGSPWGQMTASILRDLPRPRHKDVRNYVRDHFSETVEA